MDNRQSEEREDEEEEQKDEVGGEGKDAGQITDGVAHRGWKTRMGTENGMGDTRGNATDT